MSLSRRFSVVDPALPRSVLPSGNPSLRLLGMEDQALAGMVIEMQASIRGGGSAHTWAAGFM
jgi:hypothetical protein